jgi:hypothetical protein
MLALNNVLDLGALQIMEAQPVCLYVRLAQVVKHLLCEGEALISDPSSTKKKKTVHMCAECWWLNPVILATWKAEVRRISV